MGFFSWITQDTLEVIWNRHSQQPMVTVYMIDHLGNIWEEPSYNGYGHFGGKAIFELAAELNGHSHCTPFEKRMIGTSLMMSHDTTGITFPNLVRHRHTPWINEQPMYSYTQGFYYCEDADVEPIITAIGRRFTTRASLNPFHK